MEFINPNMLSFKILIFAKKGIDIGYVETRILSINQCSLHGYLL